MGNKYTKSFSDAFKMYLEILPRQAFSNTLDSLVNVI